MESIDGDSCAVRTLRRMNVSADIELADGSGLEEPMGLAPAWVTGWVPAPVWSVTTPRRTAICGEQVSY